MFRAELREDTAYVKVGETAGGTTLFTDEAVAPGVDYWYSVLAVNAAGCESTVENPHLAQLTPQGILDISAVLLDDAPLGNRSGGADPGETVDLLITLNNVGLADAVDPAGRLLVLTDGVTLLEDQAAWPPSIPAGASAVNAGTLRFRLSPSIDCGSLLQFQLLPADGGSGCSSEVNVFEARVGKLIEGQYVCDPTPPCFVEPTFAGLEATVAGASCGQTRLTWQPAASNCSNAVVTYNVYRGTDPGFVPEAASLIAQGLSGTTFDDDLLQPDQTYYYLVRPVDSRSGEAASAVVRSVVAPSAPDLQAPIFTGLADVRTGAGCGETLLTWSAALETCSLPVSYEIYRSTDPQFTPGPAQRIGSTLETTFVDPALVPGTDYTYVVQARDALGSQETNILRRAAPALALDRSIVGTGFEPDAVEHALAGVIAPSATMRLRFTAADLGSGSLVEAGIDDFEVVDRGQGCGGCPVPATGVATISVDLSGDDVIVDWSQDPSGSARYVVYKLTGPAFAEALRIGSTESKTFTHSGAALTGESFYYRVSAVDACGNESALD